jgi:hypothetical protein
MMDVKNPTASGATSITSMLVRNAIAKNQEQKEVLVEPVREEAPKKVSKAGEPSTQSANTTPEKDSPQPAPTTGHLVNVDV